MKLSHERLFRKVDLKLGSFVGRLHTETLHIFITSLVSKTLECSIPNYHMVGPSPWLIPPVCCPTGIARKEPQAGTAKRPHETASVPATNVAVPPRGGAAIVTGSAGGAVPRVNSPASARHHATLGPHITTTNKNLGPSAIPARGNVPVFSSNSGRLCEPCAQSDL